MTDDLSLKIRTKLFIKGFSILWSTSKTYFIIIIFISFLSGFINPLIAIIWQYLLNLITSMIQNTHWDSLIVSQMAIFSGLTLLSYLFTELLVYIKQIYCDMLDKYITQSVLSKCSSFDMKTYDNPEIYNHINTSITETGVKCLSLLDGITDIIISIIHLISYMIIVAQLHWFIIPICILSSLPLLYVTLNISTFLYELFHQRTETKRLIDYLKMLVTKNDNVKEVKLYRIGKRLIDFINNIYSDFIKQDKRNKKKFFIRKGVIETIDETISMLAKIIIIFISIGKRSNIGEIVLFINAQSALKAAILSLLSQISEVHTTLLYLQSIDIVDSTYNNISKTESGIEPFNPNFNTIEFKNVSFKYPNTEMYILRNVSFKIENGKTYYLVGLNGSGKTTFIKLLLRLYEPTEGAILIDNTNINIVNIEEYYSHISAVFQDFLKLPYSVLDNIALRDSTPNHCQYERAINIAGIKELIDDFPSKENTLLMKDWSGGVEISQGQWQKIAIARSCYENCAISILDEPFSSLDAIAESEIIYKLNNERKGKLTIYVTHRFSSISSEDQIIVMKNGNIAESGTHSELISNKQQYYNLYTTQLRELNKSNTELYQ